MVKHTNDKIVREINKLNENESTIVLDYISQILSTKNTPIHDKSIAKDDLIASLSEKRENQRACQVIEWEKTRRRNVQRAA